MGWLLSDLSRPTRLNLVPDLARFPELRFLDRFYWIVPLLLAVALYAAGEVLEASDPSLGTTGWQLLVWGFLVSTFFVYQVSYSVNSIAHRFGTRRFETRDESRNVWWLALPTLGEGWHNNHHRWPSSVRQGLRWWEIDITWYVLLLFERLGIVRDLQVASGRQEGKVAA
jgi:stearoyl-CoA desaturase (delta-9 desaturase)